MAGAIVKIQWFVIIMTIGIIYLETKTFLLGENGILHQKREKLVTIIATTPSIKESKSVETPRNYSNILSYPGTLTNRSRRFLDWILSHKILEGENWLVLVLRHPLEGALAEFSRFQFFNEKLDRQFWPLHVQSYVKSWKRWHEHLMAKYEPGMMLKQSICVLQLEMLLNKISKAIEELKKCGVKMMPEDVTFPPDFFALDEEDRKFAKLQRIFPVEKTFIEEISVKYEAITKRMSQFAKPRTSSGYSHFEILKRSTNVSNFDGKTCSWKQLELLEPPGPSVVLASKPGSGNTWTRYLLQMATGIQTGSFYNDTTLKKTGYPGEGINNGSVLAVKHHRINFEYDRAIVLVRDPLSAFLAEFNRQKGEASRSTSKHVALAPLTAFMTNEWPQFVKDKFLAWTSFNRNAVQYYSKDNLCTVIYEQLTHDPVRGLQPCLDFLGFSIVDPIGRCLKTKAEGQFHRSTRPEEEIGNIMAQLPPKLMQEIQLKKNESMQHLLANSIHSGFGHTLYGKK